MKGERLTAAAVKDAYGGNIKEKKVDHSLLWVVSQHNTMMQQVLKKGSMKNYLTTERYLKSFFSKQLKTADLLLKDLAYEYNHAWAHTIKASNIDKRPLLLTHFTLIKKMNRKFKDFTSFTIN